MTSLWTCEFLMLAMSIIVFTAQSRKLDRRGGNILILSNSTSQKYDYSFPDKHWKYDVMVSFVVSVGNLSKDDSFTLKGFGLVQNTSCFLLVQKVAGAQRPFSNSCIVDEGKAETHGCKVVKNLRLRMIIRTAASPVKKNLFYISYSLNACNADTNVTTKAPFFFSNHMRVASTAYESTAKTYAESTPGILPTGYVGPSGKKNGLLPEFEPLQVPTTVADDAAVSNCPDCNRNQHTILIVATISGTIVVIIIIFVLIRCLHKRVPRKGSTASSNQLETTISSIGSSMPSAWTSDELSIDTAACRPSELTEKYIFSPPVFRRPFEYPTVEAGSQYYSRPTPPTVGENPPSSPDRVYDKPLHAIKLRTSSPKYGTSTDETAMAYVVSPVEDYQKHNIDASFSTVLAELLNSRPMGDNIKTEDAEGNYVNQAFAPNIKDKTTDAEAMEDHVDPHEALYHIIVSGKEQQHQYDIPEFIPPPSEFELLPREQNPYDCPYSLPSSSGQARIVRAAGQHDYVNVLPPIEEGKEQCYEKMEDQYERPQKQQRNEYVSMKWKPIRCTEYRANSGENEG